MDLQDWSSLENLVEVEIIKQISPETLIELLVYDSFLHKKGFPYHEYEGTITSLEPNKLNKDKKDGLQIIVKLFLLHGIHSLQIADILDEEDSKKMLAFLIENQRYSFKMLNQLTIETKAT